MIEGGTRSPPLASVSIPKDIHTCVHDTQYFTHTLHFHVWTHTHKHTHTTHDTHKIHTYTQAYHHHGHVILCSAILTLIHRLPRSQNQVVEKKSLEMDINRMKVLQCSWSLAAPGFQHLPPTQWSVRALSSNKQ